MFDLFILFNHVVLDSFTSVLMVVTGMILYKLSQGLVIAVLIIFLVPLFTSAPFIPTGKKVFQKIFEFADIKPGDKVYDLGCGERCFIFEAERRGGSCNRH